MKRKINISSGLCQTDADRSENVDGENRGRVIEYRYKVGANGKPHTGPL